MSWLINSSKLTCHKRTELEYSIVFFQIWTTKPSCKVSAWIKITKNLLFIYLFAGIQTKRFDKKMMHLTIKQWLSVTLIFKLLTNFDTLLYLDWLKICGGSNSLCYIKDDWSTEHNAELSIIITINYRTTLAKEHGRTSVKSTYIEQINDGESLWSVLSTRNTC